MPVSFRCHLIHILLGIALLPPVLTAQTDIPRTLYVMNGSAETLSKLTLHNDAIIQNIVGTGQIPNQIVAHNQKLYVLNSGTDDIMVIEPQNDQQIARTIALEVGNNPWAMAFTGAHMAYVSNLLDNSVSVVDVASGNVLKDIAVGAGPEGILIHGNKAFIASTGFTGGGQPYGQATVSIIDILTDSVTHTLNVPENAQDLAVDPIGRIHVVCTGNYMDKPGRIAVIDLYTGPYWDTPAVVDTIEIGGSPGDIVITPGGKGYCTAWGNGVNGFLYSYDAVADTILHGSGDPILVRPNTSRIYYDGVEDVLWIPYMAQWGGDGFIQKFDTALDSVIWTSGVLGNGTQDMAILEPIMISDPWADELLSFTPGTGAGFGQNYIPDNILGPPDPDPALNPYNASTIPQEILSLGHGGEIVLQFTDNTIVNGAGADFTVFENPFISYLDGSVFMEAGIVAVSQDGAAWYEFPYDTTDMSGLAGITPTGDNQNPTDPALSGGDQFDLEDLGLDWARYVRITDLGDFYQEGLWNGDFDLDAVVAVHSASTTSINTLHADAVPAECMLYQNYPNPFNPETVIRFSVRQRQFVTLVIFNSLGQEITILVDDELDTGDYRVKWDGTDPAGRRMANGVYMIRLKGETVNRVRRMTLLK